MSAILEKQALLCELSEEERDALYGFLEAREIPAGRALFRPGEESGELYLVVQGFVKLEIDGREVGAVQAGDALGCLSLVCMGTRQCSAVAGDLCRVLALPRASYLRLRGDHPSIALALQEAIVRSLAGDLQTLL